MEKLVSSALKMSCTRMQHTTPGRVGICCMHEVSSSPFCTHLQLAGCADSVYIAVADEDEDVLVVALVLVLPHCVVEVPELVRVDNHGCLAAVAAVQWPVVQ
jgi:hypothetical protein